MTLAAENLALKAENARLREALTQIIEADFSPECEICKLGGYFHPHSAEAEIAANALAQPTPTTPATDTAQAVIDAACVFSENYYNDAETKARLHKAVEAYRGAADD